MSAVLEFIVESVLGFVWWILLFPAVWLISAPFVLVIAAFQPRPYMYSVSDGFSAVTHFWNEWGIVILP